MSAPFLPLPSVPSSVGPAVKDADDVIAVLPVAYQTEEHPVLDALAEGLVGMLLEYQVRADYAAAQSDVLRANGTCLDGFAEDRGAHRASGELDPGYRARTVSWQDIATPDAIRARVNEILAPVTDHEAQLFESILDRWYVTDGTAATDEMHSFVGDGLSNVGPRYLDRLYPDDESINGASRPQSDPGGAIVFADGFGRMFVLRVPELNDTDAPREFAADGTVDLGFYVSTGDGLAFVSNDYLTADETYQAIADAVQRIKGHGIRFMLLVDRKL